MTDGVSSSGTMAVSELIGGPVAWVAPEASLHEVADALVAAGVGALVVGDGDDPTGIISERDVIDALAQRRDPATTPASAFAAVTIVWCDADATVAEAAMRMMECWVRHMLIEEGGRLVGVVSARDLLGAYASGDTPG
jgi:CBS domain-containing protein